MRLLGAPGFGGFDEGLQVVEQGAELGLKAVRLLGREPLVAAQAVHRREQIAHRVARPSAAAEHACADAVRAQEKLFREFRLVGVKAERARLADLIRSRQVGSATIRKLTRELDLSEARLRG